MKIPKFFEILEPGTSFEFNTADHDTDYEHWIIAIYQGIEKGKVQYSYWDEPRWTYDWDKKYDQLRLCNPTLTEEELATPLWYLPYPERELELSPWTLQDLDGTVWTNVYTYRIANVCRIGRSRFGVPHAFTDSFNGVAWTLTSWLYERMEISNYWRFDVLAKEQQEDIATKILAREVSARGLRNPALPEWRRREQEGLLAWFESVTGRPYTYQDVNATAKEGSQLFLF